MTDSNEVQHMMECYHCGHLFPMATKMYFVDVENKRVPNSSTYSMTFPHQSADVAERRVYCPRCYHDLVGDAYR